MWEWHWYPVHPVSVGGTWGGGGVCQAGCVGSPHDTDRPLQEKSPERPGTDPPLASRTLSRRTACHRSSCPLMSKHRTSVRSSPAQSPGTSGNACPFVRRACRRKGPASWREEGLDNSTRAPLKSWEGSANPADASPG